MKGCIGIDEVGRGPLAGPVTVCAVQWLSAESPHAVLAGIRDSKKITPKKRSEWLLLADKMQNKHLQYTTQSIAARIIDQIGIVKALHIISSEALRQLHTKNNIQHVYSDYGLPLPKQYTCTYIIKGDEKNPLIALASIIAKETRDAMMQKISKQFPEYDLAQHKGYGTKHHREMIKKHGPSPAHRITFLKNLL